MRYCYCTLFDSNYLDKGLITIKSLLKHSLKGMVYVLAMDDKCCEILLDLNIKGVKIITREEFEDERYKEAESNRSRAEYCYTCTAGLIAYIFDKFNEAIVTYIDADLCFYSNPDVLVDEMIDAKKSVLITKHGFSNTYRFRKIEKKTGTYCVEFNAFVNDDKGNQVLRKWQQQTLDNCSYENGHFGDQYYLQDWPQEYQCVHVLENLGAGVAPWNFNRYRFSHLDVEKNICMIVDKKHEYKLVFYHFESVKYISADKVEINMHLYHWKIDRKFVLFLYRNYLRRAKRIKEYLKKEYDFYPIIYSHPATDAIKKGAIKRSLSDYSFFQLVEKGYDFIESTLRTKLLENKDVIMID